MDRQTMIAELNRRIERFDYITHMDGIPVEAFALNLGLSMGLAMALRLLEAEDAGE